MEQKETTIQRIREFNRFYTVLMGTLNKNYLGSKYSMTETRTLFELTSNKMYRAIDLVNLLHIDKSYMSRIIKSFEKKGLVNKVISPDNKKFNIISLTEKGACEVNELISITNYQIGEMIKDFNQDECFEIVEAMNTITKYFNNKKNTEG